MEDILSKIIIRPLSRSDSLDELTSLLHRSYKKLADKGWCYLATHQKVKTTKKRVRKSSCYVAIFEGKIIGTICYRSPKVKAKHDYYIQPFVASFGQFAVDPEFQNIGLGSRLIDLVEKFAIRDKAKEIGIDTAEEAIELIEYYKKRGYKFVTYAQWHMTNYRSVIMSKDLRDLSQDLSHQ
jgi:ribosomal protein S18 acetylase RimI-like enzyme